MADWGAIAGFLGVGIAGLSYWKAREANKAAARSNEQSQTANEIAERSNQIAQTANSYARESNSLSTESNRLANEAVELANRAVALEYEPNFRISTGFETRFWVDKMVTVFAARAINLGKLPMTLENATFAFPKAPFGFGFGRMLGLNVEEPSLPQHVHPGGSHTEIILASNLRENLENNQRNGKSEFEIVFTDITGKRHSSGLFQIGPFLQRLDLICRLFETAINIPPREIPEFAEETIDG